MTRFVRDRCRYRASSLVTHECLGKHKSVVRQIRIPNIHLLGQAKERSVLTERGIIAPNKDR